MIYNTGQMIAYDPSNSYSCRYDQQNLISPSLNRSVDMCDYSAENHWGMYYWETGFNCTSNENISGPLSGLIWPPEFVNAAKFLGVTVINLWTCNHFIAMNIPLDGKTIQMDVWTTTDNGYPCEISTRDVVTGVITTWAFGSFDEFIPVEAEQCTAPKIICTQENWICQPKPGETDDALGEQLQWACQPSNLDCTPINPGGQYFEPNNVQSHCAWAFNTYYQANRVTQGISACYFNGTSQMVPSAENSVVKFAPKTITSVISNLNLAC